MRTDQHPAFLVALVLSAVTMLATLVSPLQADEHQSDLFLQSLPGDSILYVDMNNIQSHMDEYETRMIEQMSDQQEKTYQDRKKELLDQLSSRIQDEIGVDAMNFLSHVTRVRMAVASSELNFDSGPGEGNEVPDASFLVSAEVDRADIVSQMLTGGVSNRLSQEKSVNGYTIYQVKMPEEAKEAPQSYFLHRDKQLFLTEDLDRLTAIAEGPDSDGFPETSLADNESFRDSIPEESSPSDVVDAYMNISSFWDQLEGSLEKRQKAMYRKAATLIGFEEMERITMGIDSKNQMASYQLGVHMSGNDFPLYDLLIHTEPGKLDMLKHIPADAMTGSASRIPDYAQRLPDIKKKVVDGMTMFGQSKKEANQGWDMAMMMAKKQMGVGVKQLLKQFGTQMSYYVHAPKSGEEVSNPQMYNVKNGVLRMALDDGEQFTKMFENKIRSSNGYKKLKSMESTTTYNGVKLYKYESGQGVNPAMFVDEDQLVIAGSTALAKAAMEQGGSEASSIAGTPWFKSLRSELPDSLTQLQFTEFNKYLTYAKAMQKQAMNQSDLWSELPFSPDQLMEMSGTPDSEMGGLFGFTTETDRVHMDGTAQMNYAINPDMVNEMLKTITDELKKEKNQDDEKESNEGDDTKSY